MPLRAEGLPPERANPLLQLLVRVAVGCNLATSLESASQDAVSAICEVTGWALGHLYLIDPNDPDRLLPTTIWHSAGGPGAYPEFRATTESMAMPRGVGLPGRVLQTREPLWIADVTRDTNFPRAPQAVNAGLKAAFGLPVLSRSSVVGVLEFFHPDAIEPDPPLLKVLAQVGVQLGRLAERARGEEALRSSEERFRALAQSATDAIVSADQSGRVTFWNLAAERLFEYNASEIVGRPLSALMPERFRAAHTQGLQRFVDGGPPSVIGRTIELAGVTKSGREFPLELSLSTWRAGPLGRESFFTGIIRDISERKRVEAALQDSERALRQAAKMEGIGRLAGGVAHDFNNLLTVMLGYLEMLRGQKLTQHSRTMVEQIQRSTERASALTHRLLAFSRKQMLQPTTIDPGALLKEMADMIRRLVGEDIEVTLSISGDVWPVRIDPEQAEQMLLNLAANSRDAMPDGGQLAIAASNAVVAERAAGTYIAPGEYVVISVADTGVGMDEETQGRVFEPFFTTKPPEQGTGLGLAMAYGFVKQTGGYIQIESAPGRGARFLIYLPRATDAVETPKPKIDERVNTTGTETVMVVEDEIGVRGLIVDALERAGYHVLSAGGAHEAIGLSAANAGRIALLVTDVVMPDMSGPRLASHLSGEQSGMRVLYISGYTDDEVLKRGVQQRSVSFLQKPFPLNSLLATVRRILDE